MPLLVVIKALFVQTLPTSKMCYFAFMIVACFCPRIPVSSLVDSWPSLLALLKDSVPLGLPAPGQFLILGLVSLPSLLLIHRTGVLTTSGESLVLLYLNVSV